MTLIMTALKHSYLKMLVGIQSVIIVILLYKCRRKDFTVVVANDDSGQTFIKAKDLCSKTNPIQLGTQVPSSISVAMPRIKQPIIHVSNKSNSDLYRQKVDHVKEVCERYVKAEFWKKMVPQGKVWSYGGGGGGDSIRYCIVPKAGCTYWKRIFRYLNKDYPETGNISRPSDIDRMYVHYGNVSNTKVTNITEMVSNGLQSATWMFMFSRDPYSRLWSGYIDKFLLPDFWRTQAINATMKVKPNATDAEIKCPKDVTFLEFLKFIIITKNKTNEHWTPIYQLCDPCQVRFDVIGKLETLSQDSKYILNRYGLNHLIEDTTSESRFQEETSMLIKYNFLLETHIVKGCFEKLDVAARIWKAFKYNGYIHKDVPFPDVKSLNTTEFNKTPHIVFSKVLANARQQKQGANLKLQKREMMVEAYSQIPIDIMKQLQDIYKYDFELFDYEIEPKDIYKEKT